MRESAGSGKQNIMDIFHEFSGNQETPSPQISRCQGLWLLIPRITYMYMYVCTGHSLWAEGSCPDSIIKWQRAERYCEMEDACRPERARKAANMKIMGGAERQVSPFCWSISVTGGLGNTFSRFSNVGRSKTTSQTLLSHVKQIDRLDHVWLHLAALTTTGTSSFTIIATPFQWDGHSSWNQWCDEFMKAPHPQEPEASETTDIDEAGLIRKNEMPFHF